MVKITYNMVFLVLDPMKIRILQNQIPGSSNFRSFHFHGEFILQEIYCTKNQTMYKIKQHTICYHFMIS